MGHEVVHVLVGKLDPEEYSKPYLIHVAFLKKADADAMIRLIDDAFHKLYNNFDKNRVLLYLSDGSPYMKKSGINLKVFYP